MTNLKFWQNSNCNKSQNATNPKCDKIITSKYLKPSTYLIILGQSMATRNFFCPAVLGSRGGGALAAGKVEAETREINIEASFGLL